VSNPKDKQVGFAIGPTPDGPALIFAIPREAWEHMKDGLTHEFDLTKVGIGLKVIMFGCADYQSGMDILALGAQMHGTELHRVTDVDLHITPREE